MSTRSLNALSAFGNKPRQDPGYAAHGFVGVPPDTITQAKKQAALLQESIAQLANLTPMTPDYMNKLDDMRQANLAIEADCNKIILSIPTPPQEH